MCVNIGFLDNDLVKGGRIKYVEHSTLHFESCQYWQRRINSCRNTYTKETLEFDNFVVLSSKFVEEVPTNSAIQLTEVSCKPRERRYQREGIENRVVTCL